jgi:hypothetical protein
MPTPEAEKIAKGILDGLAGLTGEPDEIVCQASLLEQDIAEALDRFAAQRGAEVETQIARDSFERGVEVGELLPREGAPPQTGGGDAPDNNRIIIGLQLGAAEKPHPWYGPCDGLGPDGDCAECLKAAGIKMSAEAVLCSKMPEGGGDAGERPSELRLVGIQNGAYSHSTADDTIPFLLSVIEYDRKRPRTSHREGAEAMRADCVLWHMNKAAEAGRGAEQMRGEKRPTDVRFYETLAARHLDDAHALRALPIPGK